MKNTKKIKICLVLFLNYLIIKYVESNLEYYDFQLPILDNVNITFIKIFNLKYPKLNEIKLNYSGKCGHIFKYGENNKRDLVMFSYKPRNSIYYLKRSLMIYIVIDSIKRNIPNAKIICFIPRNSKNDFVIKILKKNNVLIIKEKDLINLQLVSSRFLYEYKYLKKNINCFDRVIHSDLTDIFFFSDIFKTLNLNELIMNKECGKESAFGDKGNFILGHKNDIKWFNRSFGDNKNIVKLFKKINPMVINAGLIMGDSKEYLKFLDIMIKNFNYTKALDYGYDQMLINVLYYTGKFKKVNIKFDSCTQRSCFVPNLKFNRTTRKLYFKNGCSPALIHKRYPSNKISSK